MPSRLENATQELQLLLLSLLLRRFFFCSWSRRGSGFAFFLLLRDHFRPCGGSFRFRRCSFFLHHRRHDREYRQINLYFWRYSWRKVNVADVNGITDVQLRNVDRDSVRQIAWQTLNGQGAQALFKQSTERFDTDCGADRFDWYFGFNHLIHGDRVKIHVTNLPTDRRVLHLLHQRCAALSVTADFELNQHVFSRGLAHHRIDIAGGDLQRLWFVG